MTRNRMRLDEADDDSLNAVGGEEFKFTDLNGVHPVGGQDGPVETAHPPVDQHDQNHQND